MAEWFSIIIGSLILEDPTTLLVATRIQSGAMTWASGGSALLIGIMLGDSGLYVLGYLARVGVLRSKDLSRYEKSVTGWYIFAARFVPGLRVVVYSSTGFFKYPFIPFFLINMLSGIVWSVLLIVVGAQIFAYTGWWGMGGIIAVLILWQVGRRYFSGPKKPVV